MTRHIIKNVSDLTKTEVDVILQHWAVSGWLSMSLEEFSAIFSDSEFHLLTDESGNILSCCRLYLRFRLKIGTREWEMAELVGLVSVIPGKGYARSLLQHLMNYVMQHNLITIGFCECAIRLFYEKLQIETLPAQARYILETTDEGWKSSSDEDILIIHMPAALRHELIQLGPDRPAYLIPAGEESV